MLSEEEKAKIKAEEIFRQAVRAELERQRQPEKESSSKKLWRVLNSSFGLWFLSTIVLGIVVTGYTKWQEKLWAAKRDQQTIMQIDIEVALRLNHFRSTINNSVSQKQFVAALAALEKSSNDLFSIYSFPEYERRSVQALLIELELFVPIDQKAEIKNALRGMHELKKIWLRNSQNVSPSSNEGVIEGIHFDELEVVFEVFEKHLTLARWKNIPTIPFEDLH